MTGNYNNKLPGHKYWTTICYRTRCSNANQCSRIDYMGGVRRWS